MKRQIIITDMKLLNEIIPSIEGYYSDEDRQTSHPIPFNGTLRNIFEGIQMESICIKEDANNYKWGFIQKVIVDSSKKKKFDMNEMVTDFIFKAKNLDEFDTRIFMLTIKTKANPSLVQYIIDVIDNVIVKDKDKNKAKIYNIYEATIKGYKLLQNKTINNIEMIQIK